MAINYRIRSNNDEDQPTFTFYLELDDGDLNINVVNSDGDEFLVAWFDEDGELHLSEEIRDSGLPVDRGGRIKIVK